MAVSVEQTDEILTARYRPDRAAAIAGLGCAGLLAVFALLSLADTIRTAEWDGLLGLPCTLIFVLAFAILGLTRGVSRVNRRHNLVVNERRFLGVNIRRDAIAYGAPQAVVMDILGRDRRPFVLISVLGEARQAEVLTIYDFDEGRAFGAQLAAFLGIPAEERGDWTPPPPRRRGLRPDPGA